MFNSKNKFPESPNAMCACVNTCCRPSRSVALEADFDLARSIRLAVGRDDVQFGQIILK